jgi:hypothetical protein
MIICADDFGIADDVNRAILELAGRRRIDAVSCMITMPWCGAVDLDALRSAGPGLAVGLHLALTAPAAAGPLGSLGAGRAFHPYPALVRRAVTGRLRRAEVCAEVAAQHRLFGERFGRPPAFLDSHLHVHQLPGVIDGLLDFLVSLPAPERPPVRNTHAPLTKLLAQRVCFWKGAAISLFGRACRARLLARGIPTNRGFAGVYDYRRWRRYPAYLRRFAAHLESPGGIIMAHPGFEEPWRRMEFETLRDFERSP